MIIILIMWNNFKMNNQIFEQCDLILIIIRLEMTLSSNVEMKVNWIIFCLENCEPVLLNMRG